MKRLTTAMGLGAVLAAAALGQTRINGSQVLEGSLNFCADAGSTDSYSCSLSPAIGGYGLGTHFFFRANTANTGPATLNLNGLGARAIKKAVSGITTDLADNDIRAGQIVEVVYDGTNLQMLSLLGNAAAGGSGSPGGSNGQIQYNSGGSFGGDTGMTFNTTSKAVTFTGTGSGVYTGLTLNNAAVEGVQSVLQESTVGTTLAFRQHWRNVDGAGASSWGTMGATTGSPEGYESYLFQNHTNGRIWIGRSAPVGAGGGYPSGIDIVLRNGNTPTTQSTYAYVMAGAAQSGGGLGGGSTTDAKWRIDLTDGTFKEYNNEDTAGVGNAYIRAVYSGTGLTDSVASGNLLASAAAGLYRVNTYVHTTAPEGAACTLDVTIGWTYNGGAKTKTVAAGHNLNSDEASSDDVSVIQIDAGANITRALTASCTRTAFVFDATVVLERIQ